MRRQILVEDELWKKLKKLAQQEKRLGRPVSVSATIREILWKYLTKQSER